VTARRALITGAAGFAGQWLARALLVEGWEVSGTALATAPETAILTSSERDAVRWMTADVRRTEDLAAALDASRPDAIFHLAGITFLPAAAADPGLTIETNVGACARLMALLRERRRAGTLDPVVLVTGSSEQYGRHEEPDFPLAESAEQRPLNVYAASKVAQESVALAAWRGDGVRVVATRSFSHSGPGQPDRMVIPALVGRALRLARKEADRLPLGNTSTIRDFLHVADTVKAYILLAERGTAGEVYNVCSSRGTSVREIAERVLERLGVRASLEPDPALVRPVEVPILVGDNSKLRAATGWTPVRTVDSIIEDLINAATR
jgi:GDP-4-dehydro-6-deoxy-D-mannose reductase